MLSSRSDRVSDQPEFMTGGIMDFEVVLIFGQKTQDDRFKDACYMYTLRKKQLAVYYSLCQLSKHKGISPLEGELMIPDIHGAKFQ